MIQTDINRSAGLPTLPGGVRMERATVGVSLFFFFLVLSPEGTQKREKRTKRKNAGCCQGRKKRRFRVAAVDTLSISLSFHHTLLSLSLLLFLFLTRFHSLSLSRTHPYYSKQSDQSKKKTYSCYSSMQRKWLDLTCMRVKEQVLPCSQQCGPLYLIAAVNTLVRGIPEPDCSRLSKGGTLRGDGETEASV